MAVRFQKTLFIFRRDLRLDDNSGLIAALEQSRAVVPCFIFDPRQIDLHPYRSEHALQFMLESLEQLARHLMTRGGRLYLFSGYPHEVVGKLIYHEQIDAVILNRDYTSFSANRDEAIADVCEDRHVPFFQYADALLTEPEAVLKQDGTPYTVYSAFAKKARSVLLSQPSPNPHTNYHTGTVAGDDPGLLTRILPNRSSLLFTRGGSEVAEHVLAQIGDYCHYREERDFPALGATTGLSAHLKFGTVSARRVYHVITEELGSDHKLTNELLWRDFFTHIAYHFPHVFGHAFYKKYDSLKWSTDKDSFHRWCSGQTGFPIVDAGMRQLNTTGYMHNRVRMIVASFLTKDLHIDWRMGERYFAQKLVDYDPSVNNGNWQWAASTGCDASPYFRIFNPWLQQKKFDPECVYIKTWVSELCAKDISPETIHGLPSSDNFPPGYPPPMVAHRVESERAKLMFSLLNQVHKETDHDS